MKESEIQKQILDYLKLKRYVVFKAPQRRHHEAERQLHPARVWRERDQQISGMLVSFRYIEG
jgi:hypothetical protein